MLEPDALADALGADTIGMEEAAGIDDALAEASAASEPPVVGEAFGEAASTDDDLLDGAFDAGEAEAHEDLLGEAFEEDAAAAATQGGNGSASPSEPTAASRDALGEPRALGATRDLATAGGDQDDPAGDEPEAGGDEEFESILGEGAV